MTPQAARWISIRPSGIDRQALRVSLLVLAAVLAGAALRFHGLDRTSLWNDEASSWSIARLPFWQMIASTETDNHPPLYHIILFATLRILGDSETALRLPSAMMGVATIYLIYRLGTVLWDRLAGVFAAALLAFSGFHIWYSQEARMYALLCLVATAYVLTTLLFLRRSTLAMGLACAFSGMALLYSHVYGLLDWASINVAIVGLLGAGGLAAVVEKRAWLAIQLLVLFAFLPWLGVLTGRIHAVVSDFWIPFPTIRFLLVTARAIAGDWAMLLCLVALAFIGLWVGSRSGDAAARDDATLADRPPEPSPDWSSFGHGDRGPKLLLLAWAVLPGVGAYILSIATRPILYDRYLIGSLPAMLLLAAIGLCWLSRNHFVLALAVVALAASTGPSVYRSIASAQREDMRGAVAAFSSQFHATDAVVLSSAGLTNTFAYYFRDPVPIEVVIHDPATDPLDVAGAPRVWVFARDGLSSQTAPLFLRLERFYHRDQTLHFPEITLSLYTRRH